MQKNTLLNKFRNLLMIAILLLATLASTFFAGVFTSKNKVYASTKENVSNLLTNYNFYTTSKLSTPKSVSGWSVIDGIENADDFKKGVISSKHDEYEEYKEAYGLKNVPYIGTVDNTSNPSADTGYYNNLMISTQNNENSFTGRLGYKSNSVTLSSDSFYIITVKLKTVTTSNIKSNASIYVSGLKENSEDAQIENIVTNNNWETYTIYLSTSESSESVTIDLWLGGDSDDLACNGAVFFNNVHITKCGESYFQNDIAVSDDEYTAICSLNTPYIPTFDNASFENQLNDWVPSTTDNSQAMTTVQIKDFTQSNLFLPQGLSFDYTINGLNTNNSATGGHDALFMYNSTDNKTLSVESKAIDIKSQSYYRISLWAWSNSKLEEKPTVKIKDLTKDTNIASLDITTSADITTGTNGWVKYNFYVSSNPYNNQTVSIVLELSKKGYVFYDDVRLQKVSYKQYTNGSTSTNSKSLSLNYDKTETFIIPNYNFNITTNTSLENKYPLAVETYTATNTNTNSIYGIVNINETKFADFQNSYPMAQNPGTNDNLPNKEDDNILVLGSKDNTSNPTLTTSSTFTLSANSYYQFNIKYQTNFDTVPSDLTNKAVSIKMMTSDETSPIVIIKETNIVSESKWTNLKYFIKTGSNTLTCDLELSVANIIGLVYFDDIELTSSSEDTFNFVNTNEFKESHQDIAILNLLDQDFEYTGNDTKTIKDLINWKVSDNKAEFVKYGIIDTTDKNYQDNESYLYLQNSETANDNGKNILVISSMTDKYFFLQSQDFKLTASSYYKISVWVKTGDMSNESDKHDNFGASIELVYGDEKSDTHKLIDTKTATNKNENGFVEYSFLVAPTADLTCSVKLGLGYTDQETTGTVFFDDFKVEKLADSEAYENSKSELENSPSSIVVDLTTENETENDEETTDKDDNTFIGSTNALLAASSIITALAIIIALVGVFARKFKIKKKSKKIKNTYDRLKTVEKDMDIKERIEAREELKSGLEEELKEIENEISLEQSALDNSKKEFDDKQKSIISELESKKQELENEKSSMLDERNKTLSESKECVDRQKELDFNKKINKINLEIKNIESKINKVSKNENKDIASHEANLNTLKTKETEVKNQITTLKAEIVEIKKESNIKYSESRQQKRKKDDTSEEK